MATRSPTVFDASKGALQFHHLIAGLVTGLLVVAAVAALGVADQLRRARASDPAAWSSLPQSVLDPFLLLLLGAVLALSALTIWTVARYEQRLEVFAESRARNRAIVDNMLDGAIHINALGRVAGLNASAERIFGYRASELRGQPISILFASPLREQLEAQMIEQPDLGLPPALVGRHQVQARRRDGSSLPLTLAVTEVHVGGYLVYTAVVRERDAAPQAAPG